MKKNIIAVIATVGVFIIALFVYNQVQKPKVLEGYKIEQSENIQTLAKDILGKRRYTQIKEAPTAELNRLYDSNEASIVMNLWEEEKQGEQSIQLLEMFLVLDEIETIADEKYENSQNVTVGTELEEVYVKNKEILEELYGESGRMRLNNVLNGLSEKEYMEKFLLVGDENIEREVVTMFDRMFYVHFNYVINTPDDILQIGE